MHQIYLFKSEHFGFRPVYKSDIDYFATLDTDSETMNFFPGGIRTHKEIEKRIKKYIRTYQQKGYGVFLIFAIDTGEFIGRAGFADIDTGETEVGFVISKKFWGKGYATEILKTLLSWAKNNIRKDKIIAFTPVDHIASERVMQKANMVFSKKDIKLNTECVIYEYKLTRC